MGIGVLNIVVGGHTQGEWTHIGHHQIPQLGAALLDAGAQTHSQGYCVLRVLRQGGALGKERLQIVHKDTHLG